MLPVRKRLRSRRNLTLAFSKKKCVACDAAKWRNLAASRATASLRLATHYLC